MRDNLQAALELAERGWRLVPLHTPSGDHCDCNRTNCPSPAKHPRITDWPNRATAVPEQVAEWWRMWPAANIGVATGRESGIVVVDVDPRHGGDETLLRLTEQHGLLPAGPICSTGGGGWHYYYRHPGGRVLSRTVAPGIDIKGDGGQVVAPPSVHASGVSYEWCDGAGPDTPLPEPPDWLLLMMQSATEYAHEGPREVPALIPAGERNNTLASFAGTMRRRGASEGVIFAALMALNLERCSPPLERTEVAQIAASIAQKPADEPTPLVVDVGAPERPGLRGRRPQREAYVPRTFTARELLERELPQVKWAISGLLPEGVGILAGKPKLGKSWWALYAAVAVAQGGIVMGEEHGFHCEQGDALVLALEDSERRLQARLRQLLQDGAPPDRLHLELRWPRDDEGGVEALDAWLGQHPRTRFVVIDTLARFRARGGDPKYADDYAAIEGLQALAGRHGVAILLITHYRKAFSEDWIDSVTGTLGIAGAADTILGLERPRGTRGQGEAILHVTGRDVEERDLALRWDALSAQWVVLGDAEEYRTTKEMAELVAAIVRDGGVRTAMQWAPILAETVRPTLRNRTTCWMALRRAVDAGLLTAYDGGLFGPRVNQSQFGQIDSDLITRAADIPTILTHQKSENEAKSPTSLTLLTVDSLTLDGPSQRVNRVNQVAQTPKNGRDPRWKQEAAPAWECGDCGQVAWSRRVNGHWMCDICDPVLRVVEKAEPAEDAGLDRPRTRKETPIDPS